MYQVMIADDEIIIREGLINFINWGELNCTLAFFANDGIAAMNYLENNHVDILITDIRMPGMTGLEIAQHIADKKIPTKIIILSGYADFKYAQTALRTGVSDFILKNNPLEKINCAIKKAVAELEEQQNNTILLQDLKKSLNQKEDELREKFFLDLINEVPFDIDTLEKKQILFCENPNGIFCILFEIKLLNKTEAINDRFLNSTIRFLKTVFTSHHPAVFLIHPQRLCLVLTNSVSLSRALLLSTFKQLFVLTEKHENYCQIKISISDMHESLIDLNKAYNECIYCLNHNAANTREIMFYSDENITIHQTEYSSTIKNAIRYMEINYSKQITLQDIAGYACLNPSYLSRTFKKETNDSVIGFLTKLRIQQAIELLKDDSLRLSEIAESVGFNDVSYFSNTFKKITNYSPTEYRAILT